MNNLLPRAVLVVAAACLLCGAAAAQKLDARQLDTGEVANLAALGADTFGIRWQADPVGAETRGVQAVTDGITTLTTRPGQRVFIIHNRKQYPAVDEAIFKGSDDELREVGVKLLRGTGVGDDQLAALNVLQQYTQVGEVSPDRKGVNVSRPEAAQRGLQVRRSLEGIDVVSSRLLLSLDQDGRIAFMEMTWPEIGADVLKRALRYKEIIAERFEPPKIEGATVEEVEPVILHSPAAGFYDDAMAAIRVIYRPEAKQVGQKAVRYVDESGAQVELPRDVDRTVDEPLQRAGTTSNSR